MDDNNKKLKFMCPVCSLRYNKKSREPIFLLCCSKTACKTCVFTQMTTVNTGQSVDEASKITGEFKCKLCECNKYWNNENDKQLPVKVNEALKELIDDFTEALPILSDNNPQTQVSWYNKKTKKLVSNEECFSSPQTFGDHV